MRSTIAVASGVLLLTGTAVAPATAAPQYSDTAVTFLKIVCPADATWDKVHRKWHKAYGKAKTVQDGTPVPAYLRRAFHKAGTKHARAATKLQAQAWPVTVASDMPRVISYYTTASAYLASRDTAVVSPSWLPWNTVTHDDGAWDRIWDTLALKNGACNAFD